MKNTGTGYQGFPIEWRRTLNAEFPFTAQVESRTLIIRINDFPAKPLYTLMVDGNAEEDFDEWPELWLKEPKEVRHQVIDKIIDIEANLNKIFDVFQRSSEDESVATLWQIVQTDVDEMNRLMDQLNDENQGDNPR